MNNGLIFLTDVGTNRLNSMFLGMAVMAVASFNFIVGSTSRGGQRVGEMAILAVSKHNCFLFRDRLLTTIIQEHMLKACSFLYSFRDL